MRVLPELTSGNKDFWTGGAEDKLNICHCSDCDRSIHPPELICPNCLSRNIQSRPAKGTGLIYSYTINHQAWMPDMKVPFPIVIVDLDGEAGVRMTAELVEADFEDISIGAAVEVEFLHCDDVWIPQFRLVKCGG